MKKETIKKLATILLPALVSAAAAYGYVDTTCSCATPADAPVAE